MNVVRILAIPLADLYLKIDLESGLYHNSFAHLMLIFGILVLWSCDFFFRFLFGPVEDSVDRSGPFGAMIIYIWNQLIAGEPKTFDRRQRREQLNRANRSRSTAWTATLFLAIIGGLQVVDLSRCYALVVRSDSDQGIVRPLNESSLPENITSVSPEGDLIWSREQFESVDRNAGSELGIRSDRWVFKNQKYLVETAVSFDQSFRGWHELTVAYQNDGWDVLQRDILSDTIEIDGVEQDWQYVRVSLSKATGHSGYLLFCQFDCTGEPVPVPPPFRFDNLTQILGERFENRINRSLFQPETYQTQVFIEQYGEMDPEVWSITESQFLLARQKLRELFLNGSPPANAPDESAQ